MACYLGLNISSEKRELKKKQQEVDIIIMATVKCMKCIQLSKKSYKIIGSKIKIGRPTEMTAWLGLHLGKKKRGPKMLLQEVRLTVPAILTRMKRVEKSNFALEFSHKNFFLIRHDAPRFRKSIGLKRYPRESVTPGGAYKVRLDMARCRKKIFYFTPWYYRAIPIIMKIFIFVVGGLRPPPTKIKIL